MQIEIITSPEGIQTVDARSLHKHLKVGRYFSNWIKGRIEEFQFIEGEDFVSRSISRLPDLASAKKEFQKAIEYSISVNMAKELSMLENNPVGRAARKYFIACEQDLLRGLSSPPITALQQKCANLSAALAEQSQGAQCDALKPLHEYGSLTPDGRARLGVRRGSFVATRSRNDVANTLWGLRLCLQETLDEVNGQLRLSI